MDAKPYTFDAYVIDTLMRDLVRHDHRPSAYLVYLTIVAAARGGSASLSIAELAEQTGLSKRSAHSAIRHLAERGLLEARKANATDVPRYRPLMPWRADSP
jgi:DNA-binding MarR family transcriptional regulator